VGKRFLALDVDFLPDVPVEPEMVAVKGAQAADGLVDGGGRESALVLKVNEEVQHARRGHGGEIHLGEVFGKLANPAVIACAAFRGEAFKLDEAGEVLIPGSRCECVVFFSYA
jgi:hypothetical protein